MSWLLRSNYVNKKACDYEQSTTSSGKRKISNVIITLTISNEPTSSIGCVRHKLTREGEGRVEQGLTFGWGNLDASMQPN